jgi:hypothetical protein
MAGNKTARNVFKGQCIGNCLAEVKARGGCPAPSLLGTQLCWVRPPPVSKPKRMIRLSQFSVTEQINLIDQT